jgi:hypothetical protein
MFVGNGVNVYEGGGSYRAEGIGYVPFQITLRLMHRGVMVVLCNTAT